MILARGDTLCMLEGGVVEWENRRKFLVFVLNRIENGDLERISVSFERRDFADISQSFGLLLFLLLLDDLAMLFAVLLFLVRAIARVNLHVCTRRRQRPIGVEK